MRGSRPFFRGGVSGGYLNFPGEIRRPLPSRPPSPINIRASTVTNIFFFGGGGIPEIFYPFDQVQNYLMPKLVLPQKRTKNDVNMD